MDAFGDDYQDYDDDGPLGKILTFLFGDDYTGSEGVVGKIWDRIRYGASEEEEYDVEDEAYHPCSRCYNAAQLYCVDCVETLCVPCSGRAHHPGTYSETHSLERFKARRITGVRLFTPVINAACGTLLVCFLFNRIGFTSDYLISADICPTTKYLQQAAAKIDAGIFYWQKWKFVQGCGVEDSFWKLILDTWVRTIVTETDNMMMILTTLPQAMLFDVVACNTIVPVISVLYATMCTLLHIVECLLPRNEMLVRLETAALTVRKYSSYFMSLIVSRTESPPFTYPRRRPSQDTTDFFTYWYERRTRWHFYYCKVTQDTIRGIIHYSIFLAVLVRSFCILSGMGWILRELLVCLGFGQMIKLHLSWFESSSRTYLGRHFDEAVIFSISKLAKFMLDSALSGTTSELIDEFIFAFGLCLAIPLLHMLFSHGLLTRAYFRVIIGVGLYPLILMFACTPSTRILFTFGVLFLLLIVRAIFKLDDRMRCRFDDRWNAYRILTVGLCPSTQGGVCPCPCARSSLSDSPEPPGSSHQFLIRRQMTTHLLGRRSHTSSCLVGTDSLPSSSLAQEDEEEEPTGMGGDHAAPSSDLRHSIHEGGSNARLTLRRSRTSTPRGSGDW